MHQTRITDLEKAISSAHFALARMEEAAWLWDQEDLARDADQLQRWLHCCSERLASRRATQKNPKLPRAVEYVVPF